MIFEFLSQWIIVVTVCMLMYYWKDMNEFAQGVALISVVSCLCTGVLGAFFTMYVIAVATSVPRHNY